MFLYENSVYFGERGQENGLFNIKRLLVFKGDFFFSGLNFQIDYGFFYKVKIIRRVKLILDIVRIKMENFLINLDDCYSILF